MSATALGLGSEIWGTWTSFLSHALHTDNLSFKESHPLAHWLLRVKERVHGLTAKLRGMQSFEIEWNDISTATEMKRSDWTIPQSVRTITSTHGELLGEEAIIQVWGETMKVFHCMNIIPRYNQEDDIRNLDSIKLQCIRAGLRGIGWIEGILLPYKVLPHSGIPNAQVINHNGAIAGIDGFYLLFSK